MKSHPAIAAALVVIAVAASALASTAARAQAGPPCGGTNHCVDVVVAGGQIQPVANVRVDGQGHLISWRIKTPGFSFAPPPQPNAITFKAPSSINDNGRMPANEFRGCARASATLFHCTNANTTHGQGARTYQYAITVIEDATGRTIVLDPWVINL